MKTIYTDYKRALNSVKDVFTNDDAFEDTRVENIKDCIKRLLDDELMMKPANKYTFSERSLMTALTLQRELCKILLEKDGYFEEKAKKIAKAIENKNIDARTEPRVA